MTTADRVERGFPHLDTVREALTALHRRLSADGITQFDTSILPVDVAIDDDEELYSAVQRTAAALVRHLHLPEARMIVGFRDMEHAATVELAAGSEYFIELNARFKQHRRDIGAALAHEIMHVALHRLDLAFTGTPANEILTDTATTYLGAGWLLLDAFRQDALTSQKLGYLTPEEFGYVLAKRADAFAEDPAVWFTSPQAYEAYTTGRKEAAADTRRPPLAAAGWAARRRYTHDRRRGTASPSAPYTLTPGKVAFPCPTCFQRLRLPTARGPLQARCTLCGSLLACDT
ncbi:hypothetical protein [Streptomyces sp. JJ38]|uniref:hypothetical protein n=1 Tax=Streptomyces sp. JJ38 TaxID=2738128 RepID=UPI001C57A89D|nr:hypothetical protein [Streptomyces sp. JJ38]MBW1599499.1 hypothetical protein [Streptomyces sp. JJ38]